LSLQKVKSEDYLADVKGSMPKGPQMFHPTSGSLPMKLVFAKVMT